MNKAYMSINDRLKYVNFDQIISGFKPCSFAIFDDEKAIIDEKIIEKPSQFVANSVAEYNDSLVATFYYDFLPKTLDKATALIVHEMFHAFQFGKIDYSSLLENHSEKNGVFYEYTADGLTLKYNEVTCLIDAFLNRSEESYKKFLSFRRFRKEKYETEVFYENATELIEGAATYVELKTLEQLDKSLFTRDVRKTIESLENVESYFSIRELSYKVGALMLLTLEQLEVAFDDAVQGKSFISDIYIFDYTEPEMNIRDDIKALLENKHSESKDAIDQFFLKDYYKVDFDEVKVYNPMGIVRCENKLIVKFLVIIENDGQEHSLNGDFCLVFNDNKECIELYQLK